MLELIKSLGYSIINEMRIMNVAGRYGQLWSGTTPVLASATNTLLTLPQRYFDFEIHGIAITCINSTTFVTQAGMTVIPIIGQLSMFQTAIDVTFFDKAGGLFLKEIKPIVARKTEDIKFSFTNRLATAAICDVICYGYIDAKAAKAE